MKKHKRLGRNLINKNETFLKNLFRTLNKKVKKSKTFEVQRLIRKLKQESETKEKNGGSNQVSERLAKVKSICASSVSLGILKVAVTLAETPESKFSVEDLLRLKCSGVQFSQLTVNEDHLDLLRDSSTLKSEILKVNLMVQQFLNNGKTDYPLNDKRIADVSQSLKINSSGNTAGHGDDQIPTLDYPEHLRVDDSSFIVSEKSDLQNFNSVSFREEQEESSSGLFAYLSSDDGDEGDSDDDEQGSLPSKKFKTLMKNKDSKIKNTKAIPLVPSKKRKKNRPGQMARKRKFLEANQQAPKINHRSESSRGGKIKIDDRAKKHSIHDKPYANSSSSSLNLSRKEPQRPTNSKTVPSNTPLHPSWEAKLNQRAQLQSIKANAIKGNRIVFDP